MILRGRPEDAWWQPKPGKDDRCIFCHGPLYFPVLQWLPHYRGDKDYEDGRSRYICRECCADVHTGLIRDLKEMKTLGELKRLGFHKAQPTKGTVFIPPEGAQH
jgi:Zn-finger protein